MNIRKYLKIVVTAILILLLSFTIGYQYLNSKDSHKNLEIFEDGYRLAKVKENHIEVYKNMQWEKLDIRGIELTSFMPNESNLKSKIKKSEVLEWLKDIKNLNVNVIKIPSIQPPAFYEALNEFNASNDDKIYTIHEILLDEKASLNDFDIYDKKLRRNFKSDIKNTINVIHGRAIIINNKRGNSGIYLQDVSDYNLGFILGSNTSPQLVALADTKYQDLNVYEGENYHVQTGSPFEVFISEFMDFTVGYEKKHHSQISLISYATNLETDPLDYKQEPSLTSKAKVNLNNIKSKYFDNIFVAYKYHPNDVDFIDYEYEDINKDKLQTDKSSYLEHLERITAFYKQPLLISDVGISSARGVSKVDLTDGYHRGGFTEVEQGEKLVELLTYIDESNAVGAVINSWQDIWTRQTSFNMIEDTSDQYSSSYWQNVLASDESFGLIKFVSDEKDKILIDGNFDDWKNVDKSIDDSINLKITSDNEYLYLYLNQDISKSEFYVGLDVTSKSGSNYYKDKDVKFDHKVDFIIDLSNLNPKLLVSERYDRFDYLYNYYEYVVDRKVNIPKINSDEFSVVKQLNRRKFFYKETLEVVLAKYMETGILKEGSLDSNASDYNTLADYKSTNQGVEIRLPWAMINVVNPLKNKVYADFYVDGIESNIDNQSLNISIYDKLNNQIYNTDKPYKHKSNKSIKYTYKLKDSYKIIQDYWKE